MLLLIVGLSALSWLAFTFAVTATDVRIYVPSKNASMWHTLAVHWWDRHMVALQIAAFVAFHAVSGLQTMLEGTNMYIAQKHKQWMQRTGLRASFRCCGSLLVDGET